MPRNVEINIDMDATGAVQSVSRLNDKTGEMEVVMERAEGQSREMGSGVRRAAGGAEEALADLAARADHVGEQTQQAGEQGAQGLRQMGQASRGASGGVRSLAEGSSTANQAVFEMAAATQDAQYGLRSVSNQLPQLIEMITRLKSQTGGTRRAMGALLNALKGPAGLIAGFAALEFASSTLGPVIQQAFSEGEESVEEFKERAEEAADAIIQIRSSVEDLRAELSIEETEEFVGSLEESQEQLQTTIDLFTELRSVAGGGDAAERLFDVSSLETLREQFGAGIFPPEVLERMNSGAEAIQVTEASQQAIADALEEQGVEREAMEERMTRIQKMLETRKDQLKYARELEKQRNIAKERGVEFEREMTDAIAASEDKVQTALDRYAAFQEEVATKSAFQDLSEAERAAEKVRFLESALDALQEEGIDPSAEGVATLREELTRLREKASESAAPTEDELAKIREAEATRRQVQIAAMEEGFEKRLAQIDFQIDREIEKYRQKYAEKFPELFADIQQSLEEQRQKLKREALPDAPEIPVFKPTVPDLETGDLEQALEGAFLTGEDGEIKLMEESISAVDAALSQLQDQFENATTDQMREQISAAMDKLREMRAEMRKTGEESVDLGATLEQGLADAISSAAAAVGSGQNVAKQIMLTLTQLAERVGKMLIGFGTSMLKLQAIVSNPVGAIAAGAALITLASAARNAIQGAFDDAGGGDTQQRGRGQESPPGFAEGVTRYEGGAALVGEEGPELVTLPPLSSVITNENTRKLASSGALSAGEAISAATAGGARVLEQNQSGGGADLMEELQKTRRAFEEKQFRLRGTDAVTQQERQQARYDNAGIK